MTVFRIYSFIKEIKLKLHTPFIVFVKWKNNNFINKKNMFYVPSLLTENVNKVRENFRADSTAFRLFTDLLSKSLRFSFGYEGTCFNS